MLVRATAPVRICDIGGWTDTAFAGHGAVVNFAVSLPVHVLVADADDGRAGEPRVQIEAFDMGERVEVAVRDIEYDGVLGLLKAAVKRMGVDRSLRITIWSDAPPGCGLGASSTVGVAILAALGRAMGAPLPRHALAETAHSLEVDDLHIQCGVQDQYAAAYGGIQFMEVEFPRVRTSPLDLAPGFVSELDERLLVVHTGESRLSGEVHLRVIEQYQAGEPGAREAMETLRRCAHAMKDALFAQDFTRVAEVMNANWEAQKRLHPAITTAKIEEAIAVARHHGAVGAKVNGAGGGGSLCLLCAPGTEFPARKALECVDGLSVLPCSISHEGVRSWVVPGTE
jgi:D-glycero-alpha-D-manno-heptose-7-phosphate kinase